MHISTFAAIAALVANLGPSFAQTQVTVNVA